jgi:hypothetical protein
MKEPYEEGVANQLDPESCAFVREDGGEALTGERIGRVLSRERTSPWCRRRGPKRKATPQRPLSRGVCGPRAVRDPEHVRTHLARNPGDVAFAWRKPGRTGKSKDVIP